MSRLSLAYDWEEGGMSGLLCIWSTPPHPHYLLWLSDRWTGRGRTVWTGAPSFSLPSNRTTCSSGLLTQDTSFHWRTAECKKHRYSIFFFYCFTLISQLLHMPNVKKYLFLKCQYIIYTSEALINPSFTLADCVYITDVTVKVDWSLFPDVDLLRSRCRSYYHLHLVAAVHIRSRRKFSKNGLFPGSTCVGPICV